MGRARDRARRARWATPAILAHALNNVGTARLLNGQAEVATLLERSLELALDAGLDEHVARAYTNLGSGLLDVRELAAAERYLDAGIDYCAERDLDMWLVVHERLPRATVRSSRATGTRPRTRRIDRARPPRRASYRRGSTPLVVIGRLRARRGDPAPWRACSTRRSSSRA